MSTRPASASDPHRHRTTPRYQTTRSRRVWPPRGPGPFASLTRPRGEPPVDRDCQEWAQGSPASLMPLLALPAARSAPHDPAAPGTPTVEPCLHPRLQDLRRFASAAALVRGPHGRRATDPSGTEVAERL